MAFSVVMPALEMAQETGKLLAWRKKEGDRVTKGEPLLEIETDKAVVEVEAPADGILAGIKASAGTNVPVGQTIAWILAPGEALPIERESASPSARAGSPKTESSKTEPSKTEPSVVASAASGSSGQAAASSPKISPKARRLAKELGVDIATMHGSGSDGEILASDVQAAAASSVAPPATENDSAGLEVPSTLGRLMAERTTQSWTTVPHFFVTREIEALALNQYREQVVAEMERTRPESSKPDSSKSDSSKPDSSKNVRITHTDLLVALASRVLLKHPRLNASWSAGGIRLHDFVNMGIAIAVGDGVVAAVIPNAHTATLAEISIRRRDIAERARAGKLRPADINGATFTISNLGMYQVDQFSAIITPPQAAILAVGSIAERIVAVNGQPVVRPMMTLTVSCDHRVADGARAALFLGDLTDAIREPARFVR
jgi:pyruvate dehydrogenase E2 component (dihydrolipoamide acetyltransferase)